jgi:endonuclease-3 related protein
MRNGNKVKADELLFRGLYDLLMETYGPQGWWPLPFRAGAKGFDVRGYHPGDYRQPRSARGRLEIIMGAVLTQNTSWTNAEAALHNLAGAGVNSPSTLFSLNPARLARLIRPSGYYNQKARKLRAFAPLLPDITSGAPPSRGALLSVWGVGEETADSILLYAFRLSFFVVDAYTRRLLLRLGRIHGKEKYADIQAMFHSALPADHTLFNEYHALIVEHAKKHCRSKPVCTGCPVSFCPSCKS